MNWKPISEADLWEKLNASEQRMALPQLRLWEAIRISPEKWALEPHGAAGGGFWVVAILGTAVVWYNDIEEGFNFSKYSSFGHISEYWCNQDELEHTLQQILSFVQAGKSVSPCASPPQPGIYSGT